MSLTVSRIIEMTFASFSQQKTKCMDTIIVFFIMGKSLQLLAISFTDREAK